MTNTLGYQGNSNTLLCQPHQIPITSIPWQPYHDNHIWLPWLPHQARLPGQPHQVDNAIIPGYHYNHTRLPWQPYDYEATMTITPGCYCKHVTWSTNQLFNYTGLTWLPHHVAMTTRPCYHDNTQDCHRNHTRLSWQPFETTMTDHQVFIANTPDHHVNYTRLPWLTHQVSTATTLGFHSNHAILQRCHGNCNSLLSPINRSSRGI
jgi:hypothetical protein